MRLQYNAEVYQEHGTEHILKNPYCGVFLEMGLGKTVLTIQAIARLKKMGHKGKWLIIAPKKVAVSTWPDELAKWEFCKDLKYSVVANPVEAKRKMALKADADIYIINVDNVNWLVSYYQMAWPFPYVIIDESSKFKAYNSRRFKSIKSILGYIQRIVLLTGTPMPNTLIDLWAQIYILDRGERLYPTIGQYRNYFFNEGRKKDHVVFNYELKKGKDDLYGEDIYEAMIHNRISDICISMKQEDWGKLPERIDREYNISMSPDVRKKYDDFEEEMVLELIGGEEVTAANAAALSGKLLQFAGGAVYTEKPVFAEVHREKIDALEEIIDTANGHPVLVFYYFKHERTRILEALKGYKVTELANESEIKAWNDKAYDVALVHPQSHGHGLNLQAGGHICVWYALPWSLELYQQGVARLHRKGQMQSVIVHHLICKGTVDEDVMAALLHKARGQEKLMQAIKARVDDIRKRTRR